MSIVRRPSVSNFEYWINISTFEYNAQRDEWNANPLAYNVTHLKDIHRNKILNKKCNNMLYCIHYIHTCRNDARTRAINPGALTTIKPSKIPIGLKLHKIPK